ncbi:trypsin-like peptidase domain-containing protein [Sorangium sp. So ce1128]
MIIRQQDQTQGVFELIAGLRAVARGVARVLVGAESETRFRTTGFWITDTLVVIPAFALDRGGIWVESWTEEGDVVRREATREGPSLRLSYGDHGVSLLRATTGSPGGALRFATAPCRRDDPVFVIHCIPDFPEPAVSVGRVREPNETGNLDVAKYLFHDANTASGSSGGPVLSQRLHLVGVHVGGMEAGNFALPGAALLEALRGSQHWEEIARHHRFADVDAARKAMLEPAPRVAAGFAELAAAVCWNFDPSAFSPDERARLRDLVIDPSEAQWCLRPRERRRLLEAAPSLAALRDARRGANAAVDDKRQLAVDRVLRGPPFTLPEIEDETLSYMLQLTRWFADLIPDLPSNDEVARALATRRVRGRLDAIAGPSFRGRERELADLERWYHDLEAGPRVVTAVGGMGKSALIARFASKLLPETLLLWFDFDRVDLAPDDAVSILETARDQANAQIEGFEAPDLSAGDWLSAAHEMGARLAAAAAPGRPPLVVLDSFEVAQYSAQYREIWPVLDALAAGAPTLRVLVTGRGTVQPFKLAGRDATTMKLDGLDRADAEMWLRDQGIVENSELKQIVDVSKRMPLILGLAARLVGTGGSTKGLSDKLSPKVVQALLYERILDRVQAGLRDVAKGALVLRRLTAEMLQPVLGAIVDVRRSGLFESLGREMAFVEPGPELRLRADLREATLELLARDEPDFVEAIDRSAATWYARQDTSDPSNAAELVYHRLRLGDVPGAEAAWRDGCADRLRGAEVDLEGEALRWLRRRLGAASADEVPLEAWESEAAERIRGSISRGLERVVPHILDERRERSSASPLVFYDALWRWRDGDHEVAKSLVESAAPRRELSVLRAFFAEEQREPAVADQHLARVDGREHWADRRSGTLEAAAVHAARVRSTVRLDEERRLAEALRRKESDAVPRLLRPFFQLLSPFAVRPSLRRAFGTMESEPYSNGDASAFTERLRPFIEQLVFIAALLRGSRSDPAMGRLNAWGSELIGAAERAPSPALEVIDLSITLGEAAAARATLTTAEFIGAAPFLAMRKENDLVLRLAVGTGAVIARPADTGRLARSLPFEGLAADRLPLLIELFESEPDLRGLEEAMLARAVGRAQVDWADIMHDKRMRDELFPLVLHILVPTGVLRLVEHLSGLNA